MLIRRLRHALRWKRKVKQSESRKRELQRFGAHAVGVLTKGALGYFVVDPEDAHVSRHLLVDGDYQPKELARVLDFVTSDTRVLIVGGHIGALAIPIARKAASVSVIEANPASFELLCLNTRLNAVENLSLFNLAANDKETELEFVANRENSGGSKRMPQKQSAAYFYDAPNRIRVAARPLDRVFPNQAFDLILMDIEGSEHFAIQGMPRLLAGCQTFIFEFIPHHLTDVAGIGVKEFVAGIPLSQFSQAELPNAGLRFPVEKLPENLERLFAQNRAEDGVILSH